MESYDLDPVTCIFCGRCIKTCYWNAIVPSTTYKTTEDERQAQRDMVEGQHKTYNRVITLLVIFISALVLGIVYNLMMNT